MQKINYKDIITYSILKRKIDANYRRLESDLYNDDNIFKPESYTWQGDWEGRALLALVSLWKATGKKPKYIDKIISNLKVKTNKYFYFGPELDLKNIDEQQLAGNSWFLRGLCEYYRVTDDINILEMINSISENLYLMIADAFKSYPLIISIDSVGEKIGEFAKQDNQWKLSTDTGCIFISIDGLTDVYQLNQNTKLRQFIEIMIEKFIRIDKLACNYQTHATLTAARGILRFYRTTNEKKYLEYVKDIFNMYTIYGMTLNYANYNWFNKPDWTEPCAITDSIILANQLYEETKDVKYITISHKIYYNAFMFAQRKNGGFGGDQCVTIENPDLSVNNYEAYWCCTMRGSEGVFNLVEQQYYIEDKTVYVTLYNSNEVSLFNGKLLIKQTTKYPYEDKVRLEIVKCEIYDIKLMLFIPKSNKDSNLEVEKCVYSKLSDYIKISDVQKGSVVCIDFNFDIEEIVIGDYKVFSKGELLLGELNEELFDTLKHKLPYVVNYKSHNLTPIINMLNVSEVTSRMLKQKIVF